MEPPTSHLYPSREDGGDISGPRGPPDRIGFDGPQLSSLQVAARLLHFSHEWERLTTDVYGRVSDRIIRFSATIPGSYSNALAARRKPLSGSAPRCDGTALQRGDRGVTPSVVDSGLLQSNFLGSQEGRRFSSGVRLERPERLCGEGEVQDDHSSSSNKCIARRGLCSEHRFKRGLLPCPHSRQITSIAKIRSIHRQRASNLPIQSSPVRLTSAPTVFTKVILSVGCLSSSVPRRLVTEKSKHATTGPPYKIVARCHPLTGVPT